MIVQAKKKIQERIEKPIRTKMCLMQNRIKQLIMVF